MIFFLRIRGLEQKNSDLESRLYRLEQKLATSPSPLVRVKRNARGKAWRKFSKLQKKIDGFRRRLKPLEEYAKISSAACNHTSQPGKLVSTFLLIK